MNDFIGQVADKWTMIILEVLAEKGELRFTRLGELVGGISQKMLTQTLRHMERDGLITRTVHAVVAAPGRNRLTPSRAEPRSGLLWRLGLGCGESPTRWSSPGPTSIGEQSRTDYRTKCTPPFCTNGGRDTAVDQELSRPGSSHRRASEFEKNGTPDHSGSVRQFAAM